MNKPVNFEEYKSPRYWMQKRQVRPGRLRQGYCSCKGGKAADERSSRHPVELH